MNQTKYGCHNRPTHKAYYLPTGALDVAKYRIPKAMSDDCQYTHTALGQSDPKCQGCRHRVTLPDHFPAPAKMIS